MRYSIGSGHCQVLRGVELRAIRALCALRGAASGLRHSPAPGVRIRRGNGQARRGVRGAVSGGILVLGLRHGRGAAAEGLSTEVTYAKTRALMERFRQRHGSYICRELLKGCDLTTAEGQDSYTDNDFREPGLHPLHPERDRDSGRAEVIDPTRAVGLPGVRPRPQLAVTPAPYRMRRRWARSVAPVLPVELLVARRHGVDADRDQSADAQSTVVVLAPVEIVAVVVLRGRVSLAPIRGARRRLRGDQPIGPLTLQAARWQPRGSSRRGPRPRARRPP